ncbi:MAG: ECF transporter S component [Clostridiales bacterium]|nr:ECF transporter S component [Clostridiales bacterium]
MNQNKSKVKKLTFAAVFAAIVFVATSIVKIPIGGQEYAHPGDAFVLLTAVALPTPYAMAAAAIGASLADILGGYGVWAPFTIVIKALMALIVSRFCYSQKITKLNLCYAMFLSSLINIVGYYLSGILIYKSAITGLTTIFGTFAQSVFAVVIFLISYQFVKKLSEKYE